MSWCCGYCIGAAGGPEGVLNNDIQALCQGGLHHPLWMHQTSYANDWAVVGL